jgi:hypothetical protein
VLVLEMLRDLPQKDIAKRAGTSPGAAAVLKTRKSFQGYLADTQRDFVNHVIHYLKACRIAPIKNERFTLPKEIAPAEWSPEVRRAVCEAIHATWPGPNVGALLLIMMIGSDTELMRWLSHNTGQLSYNAKQALAKEQLTEEDRTAVKVAITMMGKYIELLQKKED